MNYNCFLLFCFITLVVGQSLDERWPWEHAKIKLLNPDTAEDENTPSARHAKSAFILSSDNGRGAVDGRASGTNEFKLKPSESLASPGDQLPGDKWVWSHPKTQAAIGDKDHFFPNLSFEDRDPRFTFPKPKINQNTDTIEIVVREHNRDVPLHPISTIDQLLETLNSEKLMGPPPKRTNKELDIITAEHGLKSSQNNNFRQFTVKNSFNFNSKTPSEIVAKKSSNIIPAIALVEASKANSVREARIINAKSEDVTKPLEEDTLKEAIKKNLPRTISLPENINSNVLIGDQAKASNILIQPGSLIGATTYEEVVPNIEQPSNYVTSTPIVEILTTKSDAPKTNKIVPKLVTQSPTIRRRNCTARLGGKCLRVLVRPYQGLTTPLTQLKFNNDSTLEKDKPLLHANLNEVFPGLFNKNIKNNGKINDFHDKDIDLESKGSESLSVFIAPNSTSSQIEQRSFLKNSNKDKLHRQASHNFNVPVVKNDNFIEFSDSTIPQETHHQHIHIHKSDFPRPNQSQRDQRQHGFKASDLIDSGKSATPVFHPNLEVQSVGGAFKPGKLETGFVPSIYLQNYFGNQQAKDLNAPTPSCQCVPLHYCPEINLAARPVIDLNPRNTETHILSLASIPVPDNDGPGDREARLLKFQFSDAASDQRVKRSDLNHAHLPRRHHQNHEKQICSDGTVCCQRPVIPSSVASPGQTPEQRPIHQQQPQLSQPSILSQTFTPTQPQTSQLPLPNQVTQPPQIFHQPSSGFLNTGDNIPVAAPQCGRQNTNGIHGRIKNPIGLRKNEAQFGEFPWQAAILKEESNELMYVCGGTLIDAHHLVTAAHCVNKVSLDKLRIRLGEWDVSDDKEFYPYVEVTPDAIFPHPLFSPLNLENDIAVIWVREEMLAHQYPHISPICLPTREMDPSGLRCQVTGWGKDAFGADGNFQTTLKKLEIPMVGRTDCEAALRTTPLGQSYSLPLGMICAGGEGGKDACKGDGGGPLTCSGSDGASYLTGIVSWGIGCGAPRIPGVYADVSHYVGWINSIKRLSL